MALFSGRLSRLGLAQTVEQPEHDSLEEPWGRYLNKTRENRRSGRGRVVNKHGKRFPI